MRLWLDVDDLFFFAARSARPTGIQRLTGEVYKALAHRYLNQVGFVVHDSNRCGFRVVDWARVLATYTGLTGSTSSGPQTPMAVEVVPPPPPVARSDKQTLFRRLFSPWREEGPRLVPTDDDLNGSCLSSQCGPNDVLFSLGAPWHDENYAARVERMRSATGMHFGMLVHDLIPLLCPQFFEHGRAPHFEEFMRNTLPQANVLLTNSEATGRDVKRWAAAAQVPLRARPTPIPIGTGFDRPPPGPLPAGLEPGSYVLFVSTIEVRKNHLQAFRVWCRLLQEMPRESVPTLVFAGSLGWMVGDLIKAIESTNFLNGKFMMLNSPDDATLCALYRACRFSLFLSYYEGWGLPVSDSLSFGKICVASDRTSMPEAGGPHCVYVDPDNNTGAYDAIRKLIEEPDHLKQLERKLAKELRAVEWSAAADCVMRMAASLDAPQTPNVTLQLPAK